MKTLLLRSSLILCLLFLGLKNAEAAQTSVLTENQVTDGTANPIYQGQTGIALFSFSIASSRAGFGSTPATPLISQMVFTGSTTIATYFSNAKLYVSTTNNFATAVPVTTNPTGTIAGSTITFSGLSESIANANTNYYFVVVDFTGAGTVPGTFSLTMNTVGATGFVSTANTTTLSDRFGTLYTLKAPTLTQAQDNNGLAGTTLTANQNAIGVYGMSLTSNGKSTFTAINFNTTSTPAVNINAYFSSVQLYRSSSATFDGTATAVSGASYSTLGATTLAVTGLNETINDGVSKYYYLVVNYVEPLVTGGTFQFAVNTITGGTATTTTPTYGTKTGPSYTIKPPSLVVAPITAGLAATTLTTDQNNVAVYGMSLTATGNASFSALNFGTTSSPAGNISPNYSSVSLYSSTSASFPGIGSATLLQTLTGIAATSANFTGLTETINNGVTRYYYLVVNYVEPSVNTTTNFNTPTVTGSTTTGAAVGQTYTLKAPSLAEAPITAGLAPTSLSLDQNNIAVFGMSLKATGSNTFTGLNFNTTSTPAANISDYFSSVQLYSSSNPAFDGTATPVSGATYSTLTANTLAISGINETINDGVTKYYYLVVNYVEPATTGTFAFSSPTVTGAPITGAAAGQTYTLNAASLAETAITAGLAGTTLISSQNGIGVFGMSLKATGNNTFSAINFTTTSTAPTGSNISAYFSSVQLYSSTSATFDGTATPVSGATYSSLSSTTLSVTGLTETINNGVTKYYYLVVNYVEPATTATFKFAASSITGATTTGTAVGQVYTLTGPSLVQAQITAGLATSPLPLTVNQTNVALFGMSLKSTGTSSFTTVNFTATQTISSYFTGNVTLYSSTSSTFPGVGSATALQTVAVPASANISFTVPTQTIANGVTMYYYLVMSNYSPPVNTTTFEFDLSTTNALAGGTIGTSNVTYGDKTGTLYTLQSPSLVQAQITAGLAANPLNGVLTNVALFGMSLKSTGTSSFTTVNFTATQTISSYFTGNVTLYSSTSSTFPGVGSATALQTVAVPASANLSFTVPTQTIANGVTMYYYLVMSNYTPPVNTTTFEFDLSTTNALAGGTIGTSNVTYGDKTGTLYTLNSAVTLGTATTTGLAANPLNYSQTGIGIYGFSITTTASQTFNTFNFTATQTIGTYFSNVKLYSNTTNSFATATPVSGVTVSNLASTTLTLSGLSQTVNPGTPMYYFIVADYTEPATATTFKLSAVNAKTATSTYTNGGPVAGTNYNLGPVTYDWTGTGTAVGGLYLWTTPGNWSVNGATSTSYPGQNGATGDLVNIGVNITYTHQPTLNAGNITVASMFFGYDGPRTTYTSGTLDNIILTVNTYTLTVTGNITQNHNVSAQGDHFNFYITTLAGTGTILCKGNMYVGDPVTQPDVTVADVAEISAQIQQLTINGNITMYSNGNGTQSITGNRGICYPYFSLEKGTTTILGQVTFKTNFNPLGSLFDTYNPGQTAYQGYGLFTVDKTAGNTCTLELPSIQPIVPADKFYVYFTYGGNGGTILYDDPNAADNQVVYTANEPSVTTTSTFIGTTSPNCYYNLAFAGASTKVVDPNSTLTISGGSTTQGLTMGGSWTTDGGIVDLKTNDPTVIIGGAWNNTTTINHDAGTITVGGMFSNNVLGDASGTLNCGTADITFKGGYTNNATFVANTTGNINFTPTTTETITDNSTNGTTFNNVNFTSGTTTINAGTSTIGNIAVSSFGKLKMSGTAKLTAGTTTSGGVGYLTLMSNATGTATVYTPSGTLITGNVNVQRWITGGSGYRGYRLFSSPVNVSLNTAGSGNLGLGYLSANGQFASNTYLGAFTEGPGTGFVYNGSFNPIIYLYDETRPSNNQGFTAGKNIGIYSITGNTVTTLTSGVQQAGVSVPVGNSFLLYYVGDNHLTDQTAVVTTRIPESTPVTATGYLNQGDVVVNFWKLNNSNIPYDVNGGNLPGLNQVGNPYASTIKLSQFYADNSATTSISPQFWVLDATTGISGTYVSYNASSGATSSTKAGNYIVSGQGFLVQATVAGKSNLTFKEDQKVDYPAITSTSGAPNGALVMDIPSSPTISNSDITAKSFVQINPVATGKVLTGLHLQLSKDTTAYTQTGIYFSTQWGDSYSAFEDAMDLDGATPKVYLSSYSSDGKRLSINELSDYGAGKRIRLYAGATSSGTYSISLADFMNMDTTGYNIFLIDKKLNDSVDLVHNKSYTFNINNSDTSTYGANRFVIAIEHAAVPAYVLNSFKGTKVAAGILLSWVTTNASNYTGYILQKQNTDGSYSNLFSTQSDKGEAKYSYIDQNPIIGANTYRLSQNDVFNNTTYSAPLTIIYTKNALTKVGLSIFPNPSNSIVNVIYTDRTNTNPSPNYTVDIFNAAGTFIKHEAISSNSWTEDISGFKLGIYLLQLKDSNGNLVGQTKFIKNL